MNSDLLPSLQIAHLRYQRGHFLEAKAACETALEETWAGLFFSQWLEAHRIRIQCLMELDQLNAETSTQEQILKFLNINQDPSLAATAEYILGLLLLGQGLRADAQAYFDSAIFKAVQNQNHRTLAYALYAEAILIVSGDNKDLTKAGESLDKIETIASRQPLEELMVSAELLRCYLYTQQHRFEEALHLLWKSYEKAKNKGLNLVVASVLAEMSNIHHAQNRADLARIYADLALCGIDPVAQPRLYRRISQLCPKGEVGRRHDIEVDEAKRVVLERSKGPILFGNQHLLLEMALLFIKNPGKRFSKNDLIETVWRQAYDPVIHDNLIYVSIKRLRLLIEPGNSPHYLLKDRVGYYFNPQSTVRFAAVEESVC